MLSRPSRQSEQIANQIEVLKELKETSAQNIKKKLSAKSWNGAAQVKAEKSARKNILSEPSRRSGQITSQIEAVKISIRHEQITLENAAAESWNWVKLKKTKNGAEVDAA